MKIMILIAPLQLLMIHNLTNEIKLFPKRVVFTPIERYSEKKTFSIKKATVIAIRTVMEVPVLLKSHQYVSIA